MCPVVRFCQVVVKCAMWLLNVVFASDANTTFWLFCEPVIKMLRHSSIKMLR